MKIKPLGDRAILKPAKAEEVTKSGIVLPDTVDKEKPEQAEVIAVGSGEKITKLGVKVGDMVLCSKYGGSEVKIDEIEYKVVSDEDILAVIEK
jgi:chaperonin GroES